MSVAASQIGQRLRHLDHISRREVLEEILSAGEPDAFVGEQLADGDIVAPAAFGAFSDGSYDELDPEILKLAGMSVIQDGLPRGLHVMTRRELRGQSLDFAA